MNRFVKTILGILLGLGLTSVVVYANLDNDVSSFLVSCPNGPLLAITQIDAYTAEIECARAEPSPTETATTAATDTVTATATVTATQTATATATDAPTQTASPTTISTAAPTAAATPTLTATATLTATITPPPLPTQTATGTATAVPLPTYTATPTSTATITPTIILSPTLTPSPTPLPTPTLTPTPTEPGNVIPCGQMWCWENGSAFSPQLVMIGGPQVYWTGTAVDTTAIDAEIERFIDDHGFNGFHIPVFCRWWDINTPDGKCRLVMNQTPDPATFAVLTEIIERTYEAGGMVHLWMYGDTAHRQNPGNLFGFGSAEELALLDQLAARLGPLPGWTMGYGYDISEWADAAQVEAWHAYLQARMDAPHLLGARSEKNSYMDWSVSLEYYGVEWQKPTYQDYANHLVYANGRPAFSEDRFRIREDGQLKDYTMEETRRGLWHATLAGGVANIWGNLSGDDSANDGSGTSLDYPNPEQIKTWSLFWADRFNVNMAVCGDLCLSDGQVTILYGEDTATLDFVGTAIAVDTQLAYQEIEVVDGALPYVSDWAVVMAAP